MSRLLGISEPRRHEVLIRWYSEPQLGLLCHSDYERNFTTTALDS